MHQQQRNNMEEGTSLTVFDQSLLDLEVALAPRDHLVPPSCSSLHPDTEMHLHSRAPSS
jgi:hypothetical protein